MVKFFKYIEHRWFKTRTIYSIDMNGVFSQEINHMKIIRVAQIHELKDYTLPHQVSKIKWKERLNNGSQLWAVIIDNALVAYQWVLMPREKLVWHDSLPIRHNELRIYNVWTEPDYRNKGLISSLKRKVLSDLINEGYKFITVVIEDSNHHAIKADKKSGFKPYKKNYLIKLNGKNIISTIGLSELYFLYGERKNKL